MDYLAHYGILGMKWGIRRYQNKDGTLTESGKKRYGTEDNFRKAQIAKWVKRHPASTLPYLSKKFPEIKDAVKVLRRYVKRYDEAYAEWTKAEDIYAEKDDEQSLNKYIEASDNLDKIGKQVYRKEAKYTQKLLGQYGDIKVSTIYGYESTLDAQLGRIMLDAARRANYEQNRYFDR